MRNIKLIIIITIMLSFNCQAQQVTSTQRQINNYNNQLIGTWTSKNDTSYKRIFLENGNVKLCKDYINGELIDTYNYTVLTSCGNENTQGFIYLKLTDEDNVEYCFEINAVNQNNNKILSLTGLNRGEIYLYTKQ